MSLTGEDRDGGMNNGRQEESGAGEQATRRDGGSVQQTTEGRVADDKEANSGVVYEGPERGTEGVVYVENRPLVDELVADAAFGHVPVETCGHPSVDRKYLWDKSLPRYRVLSEI